MIKVYVLSRFKGRVAIRDKFVTKALEKKEDILLVSNNETMVIPFDEIEKRIVGKSEKTIPDYFSDQFHFLIYYLWKPQTSQKKLL